MKKLILLIISLTSTVCCDTTKALKYADQGDYNLMHKAIIMGNLDHADSLLALAYYYYKTNDEECMNSCFELLHYHLLTK